MCLQRCCNLFFCKVCDGEDHRLVRSTSDDAGDLLSDQANNACCGGGGGGGGDGEVRKIIINIHRRFSTLFFLCCLHFYCIYVYL